MNKNHLLSGAIATMLILSPVVVLAEDSTGGSGSDSSQTETTTTKTPTAEQTAEMKKRLEENKAKLKTKVDEALKKRITSKCKPAQALVRSAETSANTVTENRSKAYAKINDKVLGLIEKLKAADIDTTELEKAQQAAKAKAEALATSMKTYQQTLTDLRDMDCVADPTAFAATLETARSQRQTVKTLATELRTYISTTLKQAIQKVRAELEKKKSTETSEESTTPAGTSSAGGNQ